MLSDSVVYALGIMLAEAYILKLNGNDALALATDIIVKELVIDIDELMSKRFILTKGCCDTLSQQYSNNRELAEKLISELYKNII